MGRFVKPPGWANPRAKPFVGRRVFLTKLFQLYGARAGQSLARENNGSLLDFPPILQLQTKTGCNAECLICPQKKIKNMFPDKAMSNELYQKIVLQCVSENNLRGVGFVLHNEPLTDPTLFEKIRYFREKIKSNAMTFFVTNGTLLTSQKAEEILKSGLDALHISCNGFGKQDFEAVNQGKSWEDFKENIENFLSLDLSRIAVMISVVRSNLYKAELEKAIKYWRSRGLQCFIHSINNRGGLVDNYARYARPLENEKWPVRLRKRMVKKILKCCPYPFLQMSVLATGECLICTHDWSRKQIIGNLNQQTIHEVWNGSKMRELRLKHLQGKAREIPACQYCDVYENAAFA